VGRGDADHISNKKKFSQLGRPDSNLEPGMVRVCGMHGLRNGLNMI